MLFLYSPPSTPNPSTGVLSEEELGNKLYIHELAGEYAAHVHNLRSFDAISRDIMQVQLWSHCALVVFLPLRHPTGCEMAYSPRCSCAKGTKEKQRMALPLWGMGFGSGSSDVVWVTSG